jgi:uncharacterized protein involved in exopolysaccharide biosynthesis
MAEEKTMLNDFNSLNLFGFIYFKRKPLFYIGIAAAVISAIVSFMITEKYKSSVILFPSTTSSISKALLSENVVSAKQDILQFGEEEEAEQLLQILNSDEIRNKIIDKYNLMTHYKIDTTGKHKYSDLIDEFNTNIKFKRTEFMSVKIEVMDKDPMIAANIANDIAALLDTVKNRMLKERAMQAFNVVNNEYRSLVSEMRDKEDSLAKIMSLGMVDYERQSEVYAAQYAQAVAKGDKNAIKAMEEKMQILWKYGGAYLSLKDALELDRKALRLYKAKYDEAKVDANEHITSVFIVNRAVPAEKKSYPVRWLIVAVSTISTLILGVLAFIVLENIQKVQVQIKNN